MKDAINNYFYCIVHLIKILTLNKSIQREDCKTYENQCKNRKWLFTN